MQEVAGERGGYLHGRGALDSDDLLYLKEQMEAEEDAERLLRRTEKRAFAAFKKAASVADSSPASLPLPLRVEPKPKSGIRQQYLLKNIVEIRPKRQRVSSPSNSGGQSSRSSHGNTEQTQQRIGRDIHLGTSRDRSSSTNSTETRATSDPQNALRNLLGSVYESSDED